MPNFRQARAQLAEAVAIVERLRAVTDLDASLTRDITVASAKKRETAALQHLLTVPVEAMRDASEESLRIEPLRKAGMTTVGTVYLASGEQLARLSGISETGASQLKRVAEQMFQASLDAAALRLEAEGASDEDTALLVGLRDVGALRSGMRGRSQEASSLVAALGGAIDRAKPLTGRLRWWLSSSHNRAQAIDALSLATHLLADPTTVALVELAGHALKRYDAARETEVTTDFWRRSADYYAVFEEVTGHAPRLEHRHFDDALLERIEQTELNTHLLDATLRRYQSFGSRFALSQQRVILGDEMGLGKTMQALAVIAQRHSEGATRFLVVCPASVLVNWQREIQQRSQLPMVKIHGDTQDTGLAEWLAGGGLALTTYDTLKLLELDDDDIAGLGVDTVVVDEAHYVKNMATGRTRAVARWLRVAPRVLLMTGTPMENRVEEFVNLASLLDLEVAKQLDKATLAVGAEAFRKHAAPLYLRRNAEEVLQELPERTVTDEYCEWTGADYAVYTRAVADGNFMQMRQAGMLPEHETAVPSKVERMLEIVEEAFASNRKVIVFSYFREVLRVAHRHLGAAVVGPITGDLPPARRQELVDAFTAAEEPRVLLGQIQAAGTGLNIQAASVVILCEPQVKPSLEVQAIGRAHRMGQLHNVQVHRLIIPESVDEQMVKMLARKQAEFDAYARDSDLALAVEEAQDNREEPLSRAVIAAERTRLGLAEA